MGGAFRAKLPPIRAFSAYTRGLVEESDELDVDSECLIRREGASVAGQQTDAGLPCGQSDKAVIHGAAGDAGFGKDRDSLHGDTGFESDGTTERALDDLYDSIRADSRAAWQSRQHGVGLEQGMPRQPERQSLSCPANGVVGSIHVAHQCDGGTRIEKEISAGFQGATRGCRRARVRDHR